MYLHSHAHLVHECLLHFKLFSTVCSNVRTAQHDYHLENPFDFLYLQTDTHTEKLKSSYSKQLPV